MYCLDTDIVIQILRGDLKIKQKLQDLANKHTEFFITPVTLCELYKGVFLSMRIEESLTKLHIFLENVSLLDFNQHSCKIYGEEYGRLQKTGKLMEDRDLMIASIAISNDIIFVTNNIKHFRNIPRLKLETW